MNQTTDADAGRRASVSPDSEAEARTTHRYTVEGGVEVRFRGCPMGLVDLSETGAMAVHSQRLILARKGPLVFPGLMDDVQSEVEARVVWSRYSPSSVLERPTYISGFEITDDLRGVVRRVMDRLLAAGLAFHDDRGLQKKREARARRVASSRACVMMPSASPQPTADAVLLAVQAWYHFRRNAAANERWMDKARASVTTGDPHHLETSAVWEFLQRSVPLEVVELARKLV